MITIEKLRKVFSTASNERIQEAYEVFKEYSEVFHINKPVLENFFLAQVVAETGTSLSTKRENLNYSAKALQSIFRSYRNKDLAERDGRTKNHPANQRNIGNIAYANRIGNGRASSGDGYRYRGGGYFQLTGKSNYEEIASIIEKETGLKCSSLELEKNIQTVKYGLLSAMAFWLNSKAYTCGDIDCVTKKINRWTDSYKKRHDLYLKIAAL